MMQWCQGRIGEILYVPCHYFQLCRKRVSGTEMQLNVHYENIQPTNMFSLPNDTGYAMVMGGNYRPF